MRLERYGKETDEYSVTELNRIRLLNCLHGICVGLEGFDSIVDDGNPNSSPLQAAMNNYKELDDELLDAQKLIALQPPSEALNQVKVALHLCCLDVLDDVLLSAITDASHESEEAAVGIVSELIEKAYDLGWLELRRAYAEFSVKSACKRTGTLYSMPLGNSQWASIFNISPNTMRELRENKTYHFEPVGKRKWKLPMNEIPVEYLEKYRQQKA